MGKIVDGSSQAMQAGNLPVRAREPTGREHGRGLAKDQSP
jgi:hypothetical protein